MTRTRLAFSLLSGISLLAPTGCKTGPQPRPASGYDLRVEASFGHNRNLQHVFLVVVTQPTGATPAPPARVIRVQGSLTYGAGSPGSTATLGGNWTCTGPWSAFDCTKVLQAPLNDHEEGTSIVAAPPTGARVSYSVKVSMIGNNDPVPGNDSYSFTHP